MSRRGALGASLAVLLSAATASASPDLRLGRIAGPLTIFPDDARANVFYYPPGELAVATKPGGEPQIHFLHARYTGSAASGDRGTALVRSILTVRVLLDGPTPAQLSETRTALMATTRRAVELRPLPIRRLESAIVYTPVSAHGTEPASSTDGDPSQALSGGHFEATGPSEPRNEYWRERTFTVAMSAADAQLLTAAFTRGAVALSIGYAFFAEGIAPAEPLQQLSGSAALVKALSSQISARSSAVDDLAPAAHIVRAGAVAIAVDPVRWPGLVEKVDLNDSAPPGYAALDVHCYDFSQGPASALYEKQVHIEGTGVGGGPVVVTVTFSRSHPDLSARSIRFPVAVRLDRPYRLRLITVAQDGTSVASPWQERNWMELLDVTTPPEPARELASGPAERFRLAGDPHRGTP